MLLTCLDPIGSSSVSVLEVEVSDWAMSQRPSVGKQSWDWRPSFWVLGGKYKQVGGFFQFGNRWSRLPHSRSILGLNKDPPRPEPCSNIIRPNNACYYTLTLPPADIFVPISITFTSFWGLQVETDQTLDFLTTFNRTHTQFALKRGSGLSGLFKNTHKWKLCMIYS